MPKSRAVRCSLSSAPGGVPDFVLRAGWMSGARRGNPHLQPPDFPAMTRDPSAKKLSCRQQLQLRLTGTRHGRVLLYLGAAVRSRQNLRWHWQGIARQLRRPAGRSDK